MSPAIRRLINGRGPLALVVLTCGLPLGAKAEAGTLIVCPKGCAYGSIQSAVDGAADGDTIQIRKGRFVENVIISHKSLRLRGAGPFLTVVDGNGTGRAFSITGDFGVTHVSLSGMTITGGQTGDLGGGIACGSGELTITDSIIIHNATEGLGGGIYTTCAKTTLIRTLVAKNHADGSEQFDGGGGICAVSGVTLTLTETIVAGNGAANDAGGILGREGVDQFDRHYHRLEQRRSLRRRRRDRSRRDRSQRHPRRKQQGRSGRRRPLRPRQYGLPVRDDGVHSQPA